MDKCEIFTALFWISSFSLFTFDPVFSYIHLYVYEIR